MRRFLILMLAVFMIFGFTAVKANEPDEMYIKIGLFFNDNAKSSVILSAEGGFLVCSESDGTVTELFEVDASNITVYAEGEKSFYVMTDKIYGNYYEAKNIAASLVNKGYTACPAVIDGVSRVFISSYSSIDEATLAAKEITALLGVNCIAADKLYNSIKAEWANGSFICASSSSHILITGRVNEVIGINGNNYRGYAMFYRNNADSFNVINYVYIEEYLYSVLAKEMSPEWPIESLKAQAVCARSYAIRNLDKYAKYGFNLDDTTNSQVYKGYDVEHENTIRAVNETKGQVLKYNGEIAETLYFSTSGGITESSVNVWGGDIAYLSSVNDPYEPKVTYSTWTREYTSEEIKTILSERGVDLGNILDISVNEYSENGSVIKLTVTGSTGTKVYTKSAARSFLGARLLSQMYTISKPNSSAPYVLSASGKQIPAELYVKSATGVSAVNGSFYIKSADITEEYTFESSDKYVFSGKGYGHRVGMSQWGAYGMAEAGFNYEQILTHYYSGTNLEIIN